MSAPAMTGLRKVLITGAAGFLGTALARQIASRSDRLVGLDIAPEPEGWRGDWLQTSLGDLAAYEAALRDTDIVIHAAWTGFPGTPADFRRGLDGDVAPTIDLYLNACRAGVPRFVFLSSGGTVYGNSDVLPIPESAPLKPISTYGASKASTEIYLGMLGGTAGPPATILRLANPFGPGQAPWRGQGVVATAIACALTGSDFEVWGDGESLRDYVYIDDAVAAIAAAAGSTMEGAATYNIGSGVGISLNEVLRTVEDVTGRRLRVKRFPDRPVHVRSNVLDVEKIGSALRWSPNVGFAEGVRRCLAWLESHPARWRNLQPAPH